MPRSKKWYTELKSYNNDNKNDGDSDSDGDGDGDNKDEETSANNHNASSSRTRTRSGRSTKKVNYNVDDLDEEEFNDDDDNDDDVRPIKRRRTKKNDTRNNNNSSSSSISSKKRQVTNRRKSHANDDDDDNEEEEEEESEASFTSEISSDEDEDSYYEEESTSKTRRKEKKTTTSKKPRAKPVSKREKRKTNQPSDATDADATDADATDSGTHKKKKKEKKKMSDSFQPINTPLYKKLSWSQIEDTKEFLDPCGMEATDGIIDRLVGEQVDKVGALVTRTLLQHEKKKKNRKNAGQIQQQALIQLGTACSGTDAPALALTLVKEQMEARNMTPSFSSTHEFSCEVDPFKQAYLARNFDSILYPDIAKMCTTTPTTTTAPTTTAATSRKSSNDSDDDTTTTTTNNDTKSGKRKRSWSSSSNKPPLPSPSPSLPPPPQSLPRDVYGREKKIPHINLFVAGTSCKNFSMLRSTRRLDIEDKGCSGETFLGAIEVLFQEQPKFAIFENVEGAPWGKMSEYITGRVKLSNCDSNKAIKDIKDKHKDLIFALDDDDNDKDQTILVDYVPAVYGIRCGAIVDGFLRNDSNIVVSNIQWPKKKKKQTKKEEKKTNTKTKTKSTTTTCTLTELMKANNISKENDTLVLKTPCTYCTRTCKVDTKMFGLPQTRCRTYMFVWQPDIPGDVNDDLGLYWHHIVKYLQSPVRHALEGFILNDDHDMIRVLREALRGPPGRQTKRGIMQQSDFWTSSSANLPHNVNVRAALGLEDRARFITKWEAYGVKKVPPHYWIEYLNCSPQRQLDMLDILHGSSLRDAESHDSNFSSFFWNISQNVSKEKHRTAVSGIAGCITPGGDFFLPKEGRPLLGCEKLLIQGIPYFRLALGNETEVQLGDLAGNAMSLTVVCASMLAVMTSRQLRQEMKSNKDDDIPKYLREHCVLETYKKCSKWDGEIEGANYEGDLRNGSEDSSTFLALLAALADEAIQASVWCTCETSGSMSTTTGFYECSICCISCCRNCITSTTGYNLESHDTTSVERINDLPDIQSKLRNIIPSTLYLANEGVLQLASLRNDEGRVKGLDKFVFQLHRLKRDRKRWTIVYYAKDNNGALNIAEIKIHVGELERTSGHTIKGVSLELKSFLPARTEPFVYGLLDPCAKLTVLVDDNDDGIWQGLGPDIDAIVTVTGKGDTNSFRIDVGLTEKVASDLLETSRKKCHQKDFASAKNRKETRRWLYPDNWKVWPNKLIIKDAPEVQGRPNINGIYLRSQCRQTTTQSALWIRDDLYLLMRPNISRTGPDVAIISTSINHEDATSVVAVFPRNWQPCDALVSQHHQQKITLKQWKKIPKMQCRIPPSQLVVSSPRDKSDTLLLVQDLSDTELRRFVQEEKGRRKLNLTHGPQAQQTVRVFNSICVAPILKYTAQKGLKYDTSVQVDWSKLSSNDIPLGTCEKTVPKRPTESWYWDTERESWQRNSEPGASRKYYLQLQQAPQAFEVWFDKKEKNIEVKCFPIVVGHHAVGALTLGRGGKSMCEEVSVFFRLFNVALMSDPITTPFQVHNCHSFLTTHIPLKTPYKLYDRQKKVLTKMLNIENRKTTFDELEMAEFEMPGSAGLSLIAKATRSRKICGGVIADAIGAGKTVVSIALILNDLNDARAGRQLPTQSGSSLVVVPPGLINQWASEIKKFAPISVQVLKVYDHESLLQYKLEDLINADVVIVNVDILESKGYFENLLDKADLRDEVKEIPKLPSHTGQVEQIQARGVWIPHTSTDPYGGGNNPRNQSRRNESAFYTYTYLRAVQNLRTKKFNAKSKGVPLEYLQYHRIIVDEVHESLCTTKSEISIAKDNNGDGPFYKEKNRRAGRELLGITQKDISKRPLRARKAVFGLTGTPLLDSTSRIIELANIMGGTYIIGLLSHWRKLERESCRDIFLHNYLEPRQSREVRKNINSKCQLFLDTACTRNKADKEMEGVKLIEERCLANMTKEEGTLYLSSQHGISSEKRHMSIRPDDFDPTAGHDISKILRQNAQFESRGTKLIGICDRILKEDPTTKIIVFTDGRIGAGEAARDALLKSRRGCTWLDRKDSVETKNKKIAWYQSGDATKEDIQRPRVLVLHFAHAAGLNLQTECYNVILFTPLYEGVGGTSGDAVADASTELQAIGRVYRAGQTHPLVFVYRIEMKGPAGEECFDGQLIRRNTDKETIAMAINSCE